jgi:lysozyme family protein
VTVAQLLDEILDREGGFVDHPNDSGGPTKFGITQRTLQEWRHPVPVRREDVERLERDEAFAILRCRYLEAPGFLAIADERLRAFVVDFGVNSGPDRATRVLQAALGVTVDGVLGAKTKRALEVRGASVDLFRAVFAGRMQFLAWLAIERPKDRDFLNGWINRLSGFVA